MATKMKTWKVEIILKLNEDSSPRKWIPDAVWECLEPGEDALAYDFKLISENTESN